MQYVLNKLVLAESHLLVLICVPTNSFFIFLGNEIKLTVVYNPQLSFPLTLPPLPHASSSFLQPRYSLCVCCCCGRLGPSAEISVRAFLTSFFVVLVVGFFCLV